MSRAAKAARQALIVERALGGEIPAEDELMELTISQIKVIAKASLNSFGGLSTKKAMALDLNSHLRTMGYHNGLPEGYWKVV